VEQVLKGSSEDSHAEQGSLKAQKAEQKPGMGDLEHLQEEQVATQGEVWPG
jgi:hypothetical protein